MDPRVVSAPRRSRWRRWAAPACSASRRASDRSKPGKRADVIVVGMDAARQTPMFDPVSHLVYATRGDDVETTIVNGKVLMRDRKVLTLDEAARACARRAAAADQVRKAVQ